MPDIALALGGGGLKGIAHLGVIFGLQDAGYRIKAIAGTSAGSVVGAVIASGMERNKILDLVKNLKNKDFFSRQDHDGPSLLGLSGLIKVLSSFLEGKTFKDLKIPLAVTTVDIRTKQEFIIHRGPVLNAVIASSSVPGVFPPVRIGEAELMDGGILDPVPVAVSRWLAPRLPVVAVCLSPAPDQWRELPEISVPFDTHIPRPILSRLANLRISQAIRIFVDSMDITSRGITELRLQIEKPEVIIRPNLVEFGMLEVDEPLELIKRGHEALSENLPILEDSLSWRHRIGRQFQNPELPGKLMEE